MDNKIRVLIFSLAPLSAIGGAEVAVRELTERLGDHFDFAVVSADINNFWSKYFYPLWAVRQALTLHRERPFTLVWSIMANQAGIAGARFKRLHPNIPFLLTLQEGDDLGSLSYRLRLLVPRFFRVFQLADHVHAISNYLARWAWRMGATCPIAVIPNGVDFQKFANGRETSRHNLENRKEEIIITTSRLARKNGIDILVRALALLPADVRLEIIGDGPEEANLKRLATSLQVAARVSFCGQVRSSEVGQCLARGAVFARPSRSEGLGNSFIEAMAIGLPVVATAVGGIPDFLKPGETGWFCTVDDPVSLAAQIKYILDEKNQTDVSEVIARAKKLVSESYDWEVVAKRFHKLLESIVQ